MNDAQQVVVVAWLIVAVGWVLIISWANIRALKTHTNTWSADKAFLFITKMGMHGPMREELLRELGEDVGIVERKEIQLFIKYQDRCSFEIILGEIVLGSVPR